MVAIVVVSHSAALATGAVELAREMGGEVRIEAAGGLEDGAIGTDAQRVLEAIQRAGGDDGVLVLMDLGSALMSAELAVEMLGDSGPRVLLSSAPLIEGVVVAAVAARSGAGLDDVAAQARDALALKTEQVGDGVAVDADRVPAVASAPADASTTLVLRNRDGLHARPAAEVVALMAGFDADVRLGRPGSAQPASAASVVGLLALGARAGDELAAEATGPEAREALDALVALAAGGFGEDEAVAEPAPIAAPEPGTVLRGRPGSPGIAQGPARRLHPGGVSAGAGPGRAAGDPASERVLLDAAREQARAAIGADRDRVSVAASPGDAAIFDTHLALLDDEALLAPARAAIEAGAGAERAWSEAAESAARTLGALDDPLLAARATDVRDVGRRVVAALAPQTPGGAPEPALAGIVIADELSPADTVALDPQLVLGFATARGTATAHATILARALGLPAVVGVGAALLEVDDGTPLLLDGAAATVTVAPDAAASDAAGERARDDAQRRGVASERAHEPALTRDGVAIEVSANIGSAADARRAVELGADAVGLLRSEFLFLGRDTLPGEDEQTASLLEIARILDGRRLTVRTLDVGADKPLAAVPMSHEDNPFLGVRGIRLSLSRPELLLTQLSAILRVAREHPLAVMFPMVATTGELDAALTLLAQARERTGIDAALEVGIMVEVPAAALVAARLARDLAFVSIGTNDLAQYTMAAERGNAAVAALLDGPPPAVLRLVAETVAGAAAAGATTSVCGELAGDPAVAPLLVGLGVRELSMAPAQVALVKAALRELTVEQARTAAQQALANLG